MADISPFQGVRFNVAKAGTPGSLISPPYDVIDSQQRRRLYERSDYNYVRLVLGEEQPLDSADHNRFTRAGSLLVEWLEKGILLRDPMPGFYRQRIDYQIRGHAKTLCGLTALVRLEDYARGIILPHEKTLRGPKEDLERLMDATSANLDSVWMMFEDNSGVVRKALQNAHWREAIENARDETGVGYSLDVCDGAGDVQAISQALGSEVLTIADGHHRYETALAYARKKREECGAGPWDWVMATLVWTDDPGLTVLPTHRVLRDLDSVLLDRLAEQLGRDYELQACQQGELESRLAQAGESAFGLWDGQKGWVIVPREDVDLLGAELSQQSVLADIFGFDVAHLKTDPRLAYVEEASEAFGMVSSGDWQAAILLNPIPVRTITRYARQGRPMPQKSTYFYPKLASGLVLRIIQDAPVAC